MVRTLAQIVDRELADRLVAQAREAGVDLVGRMACYGR